MIEQLKELGRHVAIDYPTINTGGCCVYASIVGNLLLRNGFNARVFVTSSEKANIDKAREAIGNIRCAEEWNENGVYFEHVGVELIVDSCVYHADAGTVCKAANKFSGMSVLPGRLSVREATWLASDVAAWNPMFRRKDIPAIRKLAKYYLT